MSVAAGMGEELCTTAVGRSAEASLPQRSKRSRASASLVGVDAVVDVVLVDDDEVDDVDDVDDDSQGCCADSCKDDSSKKALK